MKLTELIDQKLILINLKAKDKKSALAAIVKYLAKEKKLSSPENLLKTIMAREQSLSTAVGQGVAIPHARVDGLAEPVAILARLKKGIDFSSPDRQPVNLIFLFFTPSQQTEIHLQILSEAGSVLGDRSFYNSVFKAKTAQEIFNLLAFSEKEGRESYSPLSIEEIYKELETGPEGLTEDEAGKRLKRFGPNLLREGKKKPLFFRFLENIYNLLALLLWFGGILSFVADMPELGWAIFAVILINAFFSFWQEYNAEKELQALKKLFPAQARIIRERKERVISAAEIVNGDVLILEEGDSICADARLIESSDLRVDNSTLTGESRPLYKTVVAEAKEFIWTEIPNLVFAGTTVTSGTCKAVVMATGMNTEIGRIAALTEGISEEKSPLQIEIEKVTRIVTVLAVGMGIIFFFLGIFIGKLGLAAAFLFTIGIIVANVPEGLLPTVTLSLSMAVKRMVKRKALIKKLSSVETLGCTTVICTDKTGTLTTNEISVTKILVNEKIIEVRGAGDFFREGNKLSREEMGAKNLHLLFTTGILCNNSALVPSPKDGERPGIIGDPTEAALLILAQNAGVDWETRKKDFPRIGQLPFEAMRKRMSSINIFEGGPVAFVKGAPKETLSLCSHIYHQGNVESLSEERRNNILKENDLLAREGLRVLGFAYRPLAFDKDFTVGNTEKELIFLGLTGMMDPPKPEVPQAVALCHRAGIRVVMITGDYGLTALSIARKIGLTKTANPRIITGLELKEMEESALTKILREEEVIFARVSPEHKMRIVTAFKEMGDVVAVTGDGVNDAPALKMADIGIAMGKRGADVAKEAAVMILIDDNFASIVAAIEEGRAVYANIKKFITYIFASNIPEIVPFIAFILFRIPLPLTVMQILAVDLGTDMIPALGLGTEPPEAGIMDKPPRPKSQRLFDWPLIFRAYLFLGPIEALAGMVGFFYIYFINGWSPGLKMEDSGTIYLTATTMSLAAIVTSQIGNVFACRTERESIFKVGFFSNKLVLWGIVSELTILTLLIYTPFLQKVFGLAPIGLKEWLLLFSFTPVIFLLEEGRKMVKRGKMN